MFWKYNTTSSSQLEALLSKEDITLQEVMDSEEIINECRSQNKLLIDFLQKTEVMEELVTLITKEPSNEIEERNRFKYPNTACEILTCDVPALKERLAGDEVLLDKLYTFLECDPPLNPLLASYFSKVMGALIVKETEQVLEFFKAKNTFMSLLVKHLGTPAIMDLMLKMMTQVEGIQITQNVLNGLVSLLNPKVDKERHFNVAQLLCDFIRIARDNHINSDDERVDTDSLLNSLESPETVSLILDNMFMEDEKSETSIVGGIQIILALLGVGQMSKSRSIQNLLGTNINYKPSKDKEKQITQVIKDRIKDFHNLLLNPPKQDPVITTVGTLNPPLGNTRLQVTKLFAELISSKNEELLSEIEATGTFSVLLDLFFQYQWNNFLHTQVENCLVAALPTNWIQFYESNDKTNALTKHVLIECKVIERILNAWKENDMQQSQEKGVRKGYMGHLIRIMTRITDLCDTSLGQYLRENLPDVAKSLEEFKETTLNEINKIQETLLGGAHPNTSVDENDDYGDVPFPQSNALQQQMFFQYQMQNLSSQFIEGYSGFNDDAFNDGDDTLQSIDHRTEMNFDLSEGDLIQQQEIFKKVCAQNINTLDDADDQIFDDREHTFQTVIEKNDRNEAVYSSDSDEELPAGDDNMDIDPWTSPKPTSDSPPAFPAGDPWTTNFNATPIDDNTVGGWADFSSAQFEANFTNFNETNVAKNLNDDGKDKIDLKVKNFHEELEKIKNVEDDAAKLDDVEKKSDSIDGVAQLDGDDVKSAAGDIGDGVNVAGSEQMKIENVASGGVLEPSKRIEGDNNAPSASTDVDKLKKEKV